MAVVDIFLFCFVGFTVLVFVFIEWLDSDESRKNLCCEEQSNAISDSSDRSAKTGSCVLESVKGDEDRQEDQSNEAEIAVVTSTEKSVFGCGSNDGNVNGDICGETQMEEVSGEGECLIAEEGYDDWVGIERSELEKFFAKAVVFFSSKGNADQIDRDTKLELYGLQRIVLEGACHGSLPMALKVSARANWNAWQKLGNMNRETAMEKFINILSTHIRKEEADKICGEGNLLYVQESRILEDQATQTQGINLEANLKREEC